ncbi:MAG TPA: fibro-slime domain-containing protein, partial [Nannocystis sp.]
TYTGGETFTFTGDDDVWVFINKKLVIDLGGVHGNTGGNVALDTLGLSMGNTYTLDVFHAERHTVQSNFRIDTTICAVPQ